MATTRGQHLIGTVLGSCVLESLIGYGGSSVVYLAQQHTPSRKVAVKVFLPRSSMDAQMRREFYRRFLREAEVASQLDHPNILSIYSYGEQEGLPYIIMPYISGGTLSEYIAKHGPLSLQEALWHLEQLSAALDYAHERGCVHCDIKPANVLLDGDQRIMLADFGIARVSLESNLKLSGDRRQVTEVNALMGTPDYISPEQALGQTLDGRSDIYSLGILLFFLLTARLPFTADSSIALALLHVHEPPPSLRQWRADISPQVDDVVRKALAKNNADRYQSGQAFNDAFATAIEIPFDSKNARPYQSPSPAQVKMHVFESSVTPQKPVIQVKQAARAANAVWRPRLLPPAWEQRFVLIAALLLVILVGTTATATVLIVQRLLPSHTQTKVSLPSNSLANGIDTSRTDLLTDQENWPQGSTYFYDKQQHYHIVNRSNSNSAIAMYDNHKYRNFQLSVSMTLLRGNNPDADYYGVIFRSSSDQSHFYLFEIINVSQGEFVFSRYDGRGDWTELGSGSVPWLLVGVGKSNTITIKAQENSFTFLINDQQVGNTVTDTSKSALTSGGVGLYVEQNNVETVYSHLYVLSK